MRIKIEIAWGDPGECQGQLNYVQEYGDVMEAVKDLPNHLPPNAKVHTAIIRDVRKIPAPPTYGGD